MSTELVAVIVGGVIAITGSVLTMFTFKKWEFKQRRKSVSRLVRAEIKGVLEKTERYVEHKSTLEEVKSSSPLWKSLVSDLGLLTGDQAVAVRRAIILDSEFQSSKDLNKALECVKACKKALEFL